MDKVITIRNGADGESVRVLVGPKHVAVLNHDYDGWAGMERGIGIIKAIAKEFGIEVVDKQSIV